MLITTSGVPRMAPITIHRSRLERWLRAHVQTPVRLVIAPAGSGKTSLLLKYAIDAPGEVAYCALDAGCTLQRLRFLIAQALGVSETPDDYEHLLRLVCGTPARCIELIVDDAGDGNDEVTQELHRLVEDASENITLIYAARANDRIGARRLVARGLAEVCDAQRMRFDETDARMLAEACSIDCTDAELSRLVNDSDGWALALCSAIRTASAEHERLGGAYDLWRRESASFIHDFIADELERVSDEQADLFWRLLAGTADANVSELRSLQARGLFIVDEGNGVLRPYHALRQKAPKASREPVRSASIPLLGVRMLGHFESKIDGRDIPWVRRRDQQIIKYLLLRPDGRATRAELAAAFWNGTDRHLATQSMRTAFSTIRRAIAAIVGYDQVECYFRTAPDVQLNLNYIVCDVRRFSAHVSDAEACFERYDLKDAAFHYRAADKLYAGSLLEYEAPEPWFEAHARSLQEREVLLLERLADIALEKGERSAARSYAIRAAALSADQPSVVKLLERTRETVPDALSRAAAEKKSIPASARKMRLAESSG